MAPQACRPGDRSGGAFTSRPETQKDGGMESIIGPSIASAGVLGAIVVWLLFKYLPDKDAQIERLIKAGNEHRDYQSGKHSAAMTAAAEHHAEAIKTVVERNNVLVKEQRVDHLASLDKMCVTFAKAVDALEARSVREADECNKRHQGMIQIIERIAVKLEEISYEMDTNNALHNKNPASQQPARGPFTKTPKPKDNA